MALAALMCAGPAAAACQLQQVAEYHVTLAHNQPLIDATIDGQPVHFVMDLGASKTLIFSAGAQRLGLDISETNTGETFYGVGGGAAVGMVHLKSLKLGTAGITNFDLFSVAGGSTASDTVGVLGEDFLGQFDLELDFAHEAVRLLRPKDCSGDQVVYWPGNYAVVHADQNGQLVQVQLNGHTLYALLDSGSAFSFVTSDAARRAGVTPASPGAKDSGAARGIGPQTVPVKVAKFKSFSMGQETVSDLNLPLGDLFANDKVFVTGSRIAEDAADLPEMLIGADFMKAHRMYIARSQQKVYFTYVAAPAFEDPTSRLPAAPGSR